MLPIPPLRRSLLALSLAALVAGCRGQDPPALRAAGVTYTEAELLGLAPERRQLLAELTAFGVAVADSAVEELGRPRLVAGTRNRLWQLLQARRALDSAGVDDAMLEARYATDPRWELTVRHLLFLSPRYEPDAARGEARAKARRALERIQRGEDFPAVAAELSEEPGAEGRQGLLTPGREGAWVDEFWNAALALEPGEISGVVETRYGFHVLRLEDRRVVPFPEVRRGVMLDVARMLTTLDPRASTAPPPAGLQLVDSVVEALGPDVPEGHQVAARWEAGTLTVDSLLQALAALPYPRWRAAFGEARRSEVEGVARAVHAARRAAEAGLTVSEAWQAAETRRWTDSAAEWAGLLGFRPGMSRDAVRQAAWDALGATGQNATLAREAVHAEAGPLLHHAYAIETAPPGGA